MSAVSGYLRDRGGKGPQRVAVAIVAEDCLVFSISGLIAPFHQAYASNLQRGEFLKEMMCCLANEAVGQAMRGEGLQIAELFTDIDLGDNRILVTALVAGVNP